MLTAPDSVIPGRVKHDHAWIAAHIPHQGSMCLLDHVESWDEQHIRCLAISHRAADNPLRANAQLGAACGIEYAAQAMAVHGALLAPPDSSVARAGYLVSVRGARLHVARLDDIRADLQVEAGCITRSENSIVYQFSICAAGQLLLEGRAAVVLDANAIFPASRSDTAPLAPSGGERERTRSDTDNSEWRISPCPSGKTP